MKRLLLISYWTLCVVVVALIVVSFGYRFFEALFVGATFLPGALAASYFVKKISFADRKEAVKGCVLLSICIIIGEILLVMLAHWEISLMRMDAQSIYGCPPLPVVLINPLFIALIIVAISAGGILFKKWLDAKFPAETRSIDFISERKRITLTEDEILYVESNDSVTTVFATDDRHYRNKTPMSQWEAILSDRFVRIHRSYLVNRTAIDSIDSTFVTVSGAELPISRKYRQRLQ